MNREEGHDQVDRQGARDEVITKGWRRYRVPEVYQEETASYQVLTDQIVATDHDQSDKFLLVPDEDQEDGEYWPGKRSTPEEDTVEETEWSPLPDGEDGEDDAEDDSRDAEVFSDGGESEPDDMNLVLRRFRFILRRRRFGFHHEDILAGVKSEESRHYFWMEEQDLFWFALC